MKFWLSDETTSIDLGDNVRTITLGGSDRNFEVEKYARTNGGYLKGIGNYSPKKFSVVRDDFMENSSDLHAWNSRRNDFLKWATREPYDDIYFNMLYSTGNSSNAITLRTQIYFTDLPEDEFNMSYGANLKRAYDFISPSGVLETTTEISTSVAITSTSEQTIVISNNGTIPCSPTFTFTPDGACSVIQVSIAEGYGFRLEGTFSTYEHSYNMYDGILKINGAVVDHTQYLVSGSPFDFPAKSTNIYVMASSGTFGYSFKQRYI